MPRLRHSWSADGRPHNVRLEVTRVRQNDLGAFVEYCVTHSPTLLRNGQQRSANAQASETQRMEVFIDALLVEDDRLALMTHARAADTSHTTFCDCFHDLHASGRLNAFAVDRPPLRLDEEACTGSRRHRDDAPLQPNIFVTVQVDRSVPPKRHRHRTCIQGRGALRTNLDAKVESAIDRPTSVPMAQGYESSVRSQQPQKCTPWRAQRAPCACTAMLYQQGKKSSPTQ